MDEWRVFLDFGEYQAYANMWVRGDKEMKAYIKKHFPRATILSVTNLSNPTTKP